MTGSPSPSNLPSDSEHDSYAFAGTLYTKEEVAEKVAALADQVDLFYKDTDKITVVCVLKGAFVFCADFLRKLQSTSVESVEFVRAQSYVDTESSGTCEITVPLPKDIDLKDKHVLIVEDLMETGLTLSKVQEYIESYFPASVKICCLIDKPFGRLDVAPKMDWVGFTMTKKHFILGYGTDFNQRYRASADVVIADKEKVFEVKDKGKRRRLLSAESC
jgi:hypoxanthine phosphoribosyltransferase